MLKGLCQSIFKKNCNYLQGGFFLLFFLSKTSVIISIVVNLNNLQIKTFLIFLHSLLPLPRADVPCRPQGMKGHKCEVCSREFTLSANLKRHMLIHNSVRPFQCHVCFKSFIQKQTLKTHMIVHLPVKPFKCKVSIWTPTVAADRQDSGDTNLMRKE